MVVDEPSGRVFVSVANHVDTLDAMTSKLLYSASVSTAIIPSTGQTINHPLAIDRRSGHFFVAGAKAVPILNVLNARTGVIVHSIPLAAPPLTIVVDEHIGRAYAVDRTALMTITTAAGRILHHAHITLPAFDNTDLEPLILVDDQTKRVFVGVHPVSVSDDAAMDLDAAPLHVSVLDAETGALQHTTPIPTIRLQTTITTSPTWCWTSAQAWYLYVSAMMTGGYSFMFSTQGADEYARSHASRLLMPKTRSTLLP